jgi:hypothetical protein
MLKFLNTVSETFQAWSDKYPTDSDIIMACFAAYFDNCMPPNYSSNDGKPFTNVYFVKAPEKSDTKAAAKPADNATAATSTTAALREKCVITQTTSKPPYFFLQTLDDKFDVSPGEALGSIL